VKAALVAAAVLVTGCSYGASFDDCRVSACGGPDDCPSGFTCDGEGFCRAPGATISCAVVLDGGVDAKLGDGGQARCSGAATMCPTFAAMNACVAQTGCGWTTPTCTVITNCAMYTTNQACTNAPECMTDFTTSTCVRRPGYCTGNSEAQCEANAKCVYGGGCIGTANQCSEFTMQAGCNAQGGCSWH
jgi:hypothetical protein